MAQSWGVQLSDKRVDGRESNLQMRPVSCTFDVIHTAKGSARFKFGHTSVIAAIYGPSETSTGSTLHGKIQVVVRKDSGSTTYKEKQIQAATEKLIQNVVDVEFLIRTFTLICVQIEENQGGVFSCVTNAIMCALLRSGIPCTQTIFSVSLVPVYDGIRNTVECVVDPTIEEVNSFCKAGRSTEASQYCAYAFNLHESSLVCASPEWSTGEQLQLSSWSEKESNFFTLMKTAEACTHVLKAIVVKALTIELKKIPALYKLNNSS